MVFSKAIFLIAQLTHVCAKKYYKIEEKQILGMKLHENKQKSCFIVKYDVFDKIIKNRRFSRLKSRALTFVPIFS